MIRLDYDTRCRLTNKYNEDRVFQLISPSLAKLSGSNNELTPVELFDEAIQVTKRLKEIKTRRDIAVNQIWSELLEKYSEYTSPTRGNVIRNEESALRTAAIVTTSVVFLLTSKEKNINENPYRPIIMSLLRLIKDNETANYIINQAEKNEVVEDRDYGEIPTNDYLYEADEMDIVREWMGKLKNYPDKIAVWFRPHFDQFVEEILANPQIRMTMKKKTLSEAFNMKLLINICGVMITEKAITWTGYGLMKEVAKRPDRNKPISINGYEDYGSQFSALTPETHDFIKKTIRKYNPAKMNK